MIQKMPTSDAVAILHRRYISGTQGHAALERERNDARVARQLHDLRCQAGLSQRELAQRVGVPPSAISRLEDADFEGRSLKVLRRIAHVLDVDLDSLSA